MSMKRNSRHIDPKAKKASQIKSKTIQIGLTYEKICIMLNPKIN